MIRAQVNLTGFEAAKDYNFRVSTLLWKYSDYLGDAFKERIRAQVYPWPGKTRRSNGQTVTSPRDIVDTGAFLRSQVRRKESLTSIRFTWGQTYGVTYAGFILQGIPERNYPPRDWITPPIALRPPEAFFAAEWSRFGSLS
jgi:hypothetical protein